MISLSICLSDIPHSEITVSKKNGKSYINLTVTKRKDVDKFGNTHSVAITQSKADYDAQKPKIYIGNGVGKFEDAPDYFKK